MSSSPKNELKSKVSTMSPRTKFKSVLSKMSPKTRDKTITSLRIKNTQKRKQAQRVLVFNKVKNLIKTGKELEKVNKKLKKLKI